MKNFYVLSLVTFLLVNIAAGQDAIQYTDAASLMIVGKAKKTDSVYQRIDSAETREMPAVVRTLAKRSAGIAVLFETNSGIVRAKWKLPKEEYLPNMTPIGHSGLDLYCLKGGKWQFVGVARPAKGTDQDQLIIQHMDSTLKQFMLYLPLYNNVNELQIGVQSNAVIRAPRRPGVDTAKRIVIYGSSVVQGASASRPGMAYPAIMQRKMGYDIINLGFSGSAKMEPELAKYLATVPADCYVLDCIPNPTADQIKERSYPFIKYLREHQPKVPIILVETVFRENGHWDQVIGQNVSRQNEEIRKTWERLKREGFEHIYYIESGKLVGTDHESTIDGIHLTDLGFTRIAEALMPVIKQALNENR